MEITEGKITSVKFGFGGRNNKELGFTFLFDTNAELLVYFTGWWNTDVEASEVERNRLYAKAMREMDAVLKDANVSKIEELINIPVVCKVQSSVVKEFRVLKEVFSA